MTTNSTIEDLGRPLKFRILKQSGGWCYFGVYADTPEDALALLAIALFEQHILIKEE